MKRIHPFRFKKRRVGNRAFYYVIYDHDPGRWKSTGVLVERNKRHRWEPAGYDQAVAWAYANIEAERSGSSTTLGEFAESFFLPDQCSWTQRQMRRSTTRRKWSSAVYLSQHRGHLVNYILPRFGRTRLQDVTIKGIEEWLTGLDSARSGRPLAESTLDKVLQTLRIVLGEATYLGRLSENPAASVEPFDQWNGARRGVFVLEEIKRFFPTDTASAIRIWGSLDWLAYFYLQWICGLRPQEASGFMLSDWIRPLHGAVIRRRLENASGEILDGLKTTRSGMTVKPVVFDDRMEELLEAMEVAGAEPEDLLFCTINGAPIGANTANKHLRLSAKRAKVDLEGRTQYSFRHAYYTELLKRLPEKQVTKMAGHKSLRKDYDHRQGLDFLRAAEPLRAVINGMSA